MTQPESSQIIVTRRLILELAQARLLSPEARDAALVALYPDRNWGLWVSRLLSLVGVALVLSGFVYFFAFNWSKISANSKLFGLQFVLLGSLVAAFILGLGERLPGKVMLLCSTVLLGIFLAVFGQIYQTGADAYSLFLFWSLLAFPWVVLSNFAALWILFIVLINTFMILWWQQGILVSSQAFYLLFPILTALNCLFLSLREYAFASDVAWVKGRWHRILLLIAMLGFGLVPATILSFDLYKTHTYIVAGALVAAVTHLGAYLYYRYKAPDLMAISCILLSVCIFLQVFSIRIIVQAMPAFEAFLFFWIGGVTLLVFSAAGLVLRNIARKIGGQHD